MGKFRDLDSMDEMLNQHFSNDAGVKTAIKNFVNPAWHESQKQAGLNRSKENESWYQSWKDGNVKSVNTKRKNGYYKTWTEQMAAWRNTPEGKDYIEKSREIGKIYGKLNGKEITTPDGIFASLVEAGKFYGITHSSMWHRIRDHNDIFYITKLGPGKPKPIKLKVTTPEGKFKNVPEAFRHYQAIRHPSVGNINSAFYWFSEMQKQNPKGFYKNETP